MSLPTQFTPEQTALLDRYLAESRQLRSLFMSTGVSAATAEIANSLADHYRLPVLTLPTKARSVVLEPSVPAPTTAEPMGDVATGDYLNLYVLDDYHDLGPGIYLVPSTTNVPTGIMTLTGPLGVLVLSMPAPRLEVTAADGHTWVSALVAPESQGRPRAHALDETTSATLAIEIPTPISLALAAGHLVDTLAGNAASPANDRAQPAHLWGIRLNRLELMSDGLVIFSWRARSDLRIARATDITIEPALGDGLGQVFAFQDATASVEFAISSDVLALTDFLALDYDLLTEQPQRPRRAQLIQQGLPLNTLRRLDAALQRHAEIHDDQRQNEQGQSHQERDELNQNEQDLLGKGQSKQSLLRKGSTSSRSRQRAKASIRHDQLAQLTASTERLATSQSRAARLTAIGLRRLGDLAQRSVATEPSPPSSYARWVRDYDDFLTPEVLKYLAQVDDTPLISIIIPVYHPDINYLQDAVTSVVQQSWQHFELIISIDGPHDRELMIQLEGLAQPHPNVYVVTSNERGNIARATMVGVEKATGRYLAFLDQDDLLHPDALAWVSAYLSAKPDTKILYTDEDKIEDSTRLDPFFKPDFSPEYLLCVNYINHFTVIERTTFNQAGGLIVGTEGAQDWDLLLRASASLSPEQIVHIPKVLYHWRSHPGSTAQSYDAKPEVIATQERAVTDQLAREGYNLRWLERPRSAPIFVLPHLHPTKPHRITIVIPTKDHLDDLRTCIDSILASYYEDLEVLVIDNESTDPPTLAYLASLESPVRVVHYREPFNFATMVNYGVRQATGDLVVLLNNDTRVISPDWLNEMAALAERPAIGAVGAKLLYPDNSVQHNGVCLGIAGSAGHYGWSKDHRDPGDHGRGVLLSNTAAVTGAALMVERRKYCEVKGLNPELAISFNDVELCLALGRAGYRSVVTPNAMLFHFESKSRGYNITRSQHYREDLESAYFYRHWSSMIPNDPYYSPNLSLELLEMFEPLGQPRLQLPWGNQHTTLVHPSPHVSANDTWFELTASSRLAFEIPLGPDQLPYWRSLALTIFCATDNVVFELDLACAGVHRSFQANASNRSTQHAEPIEFIIATSITQHNEATPSRGFTLRAHSQPNVGDPSDVVDARATNRTRPRPTTADGPGSRDHRDRVMAPSDQVPRRAHAALTPSESMGTLSQDDTEAFETALFQGSPVIATLTNPNRSSLFLKCVDLPSGFAAIGTTSVVPSLLLGLSLPTDNP